MSNLSDKLAQSSNPSDKFAYLGKVAPMTSDPSSFNLPLTPIEEDAQEIYGSISSHNIVALKSFKKSEGGASTNRQVAEFYTPEGTINTSSQPIYSQRNNANKMDSHRKQSSSDYA